MHLGFKREWIQEPEKHPKESLHPLSPLPSVCFKPRSEAKQVHSASWVRMAWKKWPQHSEEAFNGPTPQQESVSPSFSIPDPQGRDSGPVHARGITLEQFM